MKPKGERDLSTSELAPGADLQALGSIKWALQRLHFLVTRLGVDDDADQLGVGDLDIPDNHDANGPVRVLIPRITQRTINWPAGDINPEVTSSSPGEYNPSARLNTREPRRRFWSVVGCSAVACLIAATGAYVDDKDAAPITVFAGPGLNASGSAVNTLRMPDTIAPGTTLVIESPRASTTMSVDGTAVDSLTAPPNLPSPNNNTAPVVASGETADALSPTQATTVPSSNQRPPKTTTPNTTAPNQSGQGSSNGLIVAPGGGLPEPGPGVEKSPEFRYMSGQDFDNAWYEAQPQPDTIYGEKPAIYGNEAADERIRQIAESRGYRLQPISTSGGLNWRTQEAFNSMHQAAAADGVDLRNVSGFRSPDLQRELFMVRVAEHFGKTPTADEILSGTVDDAINKTLDQRSIPGYSRHHSGYVLDINMLTDAFKNTAAYRWLSNNNFYNARRFGFIPSYPEGVQAGPLPEPWEFCFIVDRDLIQ